MSYFYCVACYYCFSADVLPDRCPDCGAVEHNGRKAVRPASRDEIDELLRLRAEDNENNTLLSGETI